jgi:phosphohistidine phosphatase
MMERKLFIIRHGKSSWDHQGLDDIDRPLAERGILNAEEMAKRLSHQGLIPELLVSSPASRALNTALIMARFWMLKPAALQIHEPLYDAFISNIEKVVSGIPSDVKGLAIFGHNPSWTAYANHFLSSPLDNLPTAGVVVVTFESDHWKNLNRSKVKDVYVDYPKKPSPL